MDKLAKMEDKSSMWIDWLAIQAVSPKFFD